MPHLFRTPDGKLWKPSQPVSLALADGAKIEATWAGSATEEKLTWWLRNPGNQLAQSDEIAAVAVRANDTKETIWDAAPAGARLIFVVEAPPAGKNYRLAKMLTTKANQAQILHFRHDRFSVFATLKPDGSIIKIPPLPPSNRPEQGNLFD